MMATKKTTKVSAPTGKVEAVAVTPPAPKPNLLQAVLATATTADKRKAKTPMFDIKEPIPGIVAEVRAKHKASEDAEAALEEAAGRLKDATKPLYQGLIAKQSFVNTVNVTDGKDSVLLSFKHAYAKIPLEQADALQAVVGAALYPTLFKAAAKVEVKAEILENEALFAELVSKVGAEFFSKYFTATQFIKPTERFTEERFRTLTAEQNAQLDPLVQQQSPSLKVR